MPLPVSYVWNEVSKPTLQFSQYARAHSEVGLVLFHLCFPEIFRCFSEMILGDPKLNWISVKDLD